MLKMHECICYSLSVWTEQMMLLTELGKFYRHCVLSWCSFLISLMQSVAIRTSPHLVIFFSWKAILLFQHTECLEKCCQVSWGFFSWALVRAIAKICMQYTETCFVQILSEHNALQGSKYHGYRCLDSTRHCPDWDFQLFYVLHENTKRIFLFLI